MTIHSVRNCYKVSGVTLSNCANQSLFIKFPEVVADFSRSHFYLFVRSPACFVGKIRKNCFATSRCVHPGRNANENASFSRNSVPFGSQGEIDGAANGRFHANAFRVVSEAFVAPSS